MAFLIGGSSSTGSSVLRNVLNRHSDIFCGPESYLFTYPLLYKEWGEARNQLLDNSKLKGNFWMRKKGVSLINSEYGWERSKLKDKLLSANTFSEFIESFFERGLLKDNKSIWGEKTPANAYCFDLFLKQNPKNKVIHLYRNPYDSIVSMVDRGFSILYAVGIYLFNTSFAMREDGNPGYFSLAYESFVNNTDSKVAEICNFLNVDFEATMLVPGYEHRDDSQKLDGWKQNETHTISLLSLDRFKRTPLNLQEKILNVCNHVQMSKMYRKEHDLDNSTIEDLCRTLNYEYIQSKRNRDPSNLNLNRIIIQDKLERIKQRLPAYIFNYPLSITKN